MLSAKEVEEIHWQLKHVPPSFNNKQKQSFSRTLNKKLKEHELASKYPPFQPLPYKQCFINHTTDDLTLLRLIELTQCSENFILDTESINIPYQPNKPALIQVQLILPTSFSYVVFVEVCHLPHERDTAFGLIKLFFNTLFQADKTIFIWGTIEELVDFLPFKLFSHEQIYLSMNINFQKEFKGNWKNNHPHKLEPNTETKDSQCICESCLGIQPGNHWSLQLATAYTLNRWLDKKLTRAEFEIGLDPQLKQLNSKELEHRQQITNYAAYDCLSIHQLLISSNYIQYDSSELSPVDNPPVSNPQERSQTPLYEAISSDDEKPPESNEQKKEPNQLTAEQRKQIHNRTCTLKQRKRNYRNEIIRRDIDRRFTISQIKKILKENDIGFSAVNTSTSKSNQKSLFIGIKDQYLTLIEEYKEKLRFYFTTQHYCQWCRKNQSNTSSKHRHYHHKRNQRT